MKHTIVFWSALSIITSCMSYANFTNIQHPGCNPSDHEGVVEIFDCNSRLIKSGRISHDGARECHGSHDEQAGNQFGRVGAGGDSRDYIEGRASASCVLGTRGGEWGDHYVATYANGNYYHTFDVTKRTLARVRFTAILDTQTGVVESGGAISEVNMSCSADTPGDRAISITLTASYPDAMTLALDREVVIPTGKCVVRANVRTRLGQVPPSPPPGNERYCFSPKYGTEEGKEVIISDLGGGAHYKIINLGPAGVLP